MNRAARPPPTRFYLAALGTAVGLGNLWRFPYIVSQNGGGAFVLLCLFLTFFFGLPLLVSELMLGKKLKTSATHALSQLRKGVVGFLPVEENRFWYHLPLWAGWMSLAVSIFVLSYYIVLSSWALYFALYFTRLLIFRSEDLLLNSATVIDSIAGSAGLQITLTLLHWGVAAFIVFKGLSASLERFLGMTMLAFVGVLLILVLESLSLPSAPQALRFLFYPDFSRLRWSSLIQALGHVCFTLSVGFGAQVRFGNRLQPQQKVVLCGLRVVTMDAFVSMLAILFVFPIAMSLPLTNCGPEMLFRVVPDFFMQLENGLVWGVLFFGCLYICAMGGTLGLLESLTLETRERLAWSKAKTLLVLSALTLLLAAPSMLAYNILSGWKFSERNFLIAFDAGVVRYLLPVSAVAFSVCVVRGLRYSEQRSEFEDPTQSEQNLRLFRRWRLLLAYGLPALVALGLAFGA